MQLWQPTLPERYLKADAEALSRDIADRRKRLGDRLVILGHHYQVDDVVRHADLTGDSLKLSQLAAGLANDPDRSQPPEFVIFCGVHFMAETADMLTNDDTAVILPDLSAGCSMADMADYEDAVDAWEILNDTLNKKHGGEWFGRIVPITYVNSTAAIKAFVGANGGACCTSSNADKVFAWAMNGGTQPKRVDDQGREEEIKILFLPDQHLGRNTAHNYGIDVAKHAHLYDPRLARQGEELGGMSDQDLVDASAILWTGHCSVHKLFRPEHVTQIREDDAKHPDRPATTVIVHPECAKEVVDLADEWGSTEKIIKTLEAAEPGSRWAIGTEVHLVNRLAKAAKERGVEARILSDCQCLCTTMYRIDEPHLLWVLDRLLGIEPGDHPDEPTGKPIVTNRVTVHPDAKKDALLALDRMLDLVSAPTPA